MLRGRGKLVFRKGEADVLVQSSADPIAERHLRTRADAVCWPWSDSALSSMQISTRFDGEALPWKWEAVRNLRVAPSVEW